ncbi:MAG: ThuA domain-containing protein [Phycisphaerae bacterium]|jgi:trehalose utilization protein|nr:ThuA domain-containing protein [Phycisphaerae bacterium]
MTAAPIRVLVWDENAPHVPVEVYRHNIRSAIAGGLIELGGAHLDVRTAHLDDPQQGLSEQALATTDVLIWWGHVRHAEVSDAAVDRIVQRVREEGLGFIALHSAHYAKPFKRVLNCTGHLKGGWREDEQPEEIHVCAPHHPIAQGVHDFTLAQEEMYGAPYDVPPPDVVILQSYFPAGGEFFPSGLAWTVGAGIDTDFASGPGQGVGQGMGIGRVFYFRPGHESVPTYYNPDVCRILYNAVRWAAKRV